MYASGNSVSILIGNLILNNGRDIKSSGGSRFQMNRQHVLASRKEQRESIVLAFISRVPYGYHRIVALGGAPIGNRLRGTVLHAVRKHLEDVGILLIDASACQK